MSSRKSRGETLYIDVSAMCGSKENKQAKGDRGRVEGELR